MLDSGRITFFKGTFSIFTCVPKRNVSGGNLCKVTNHIAAFSILGTFYIPGNWNKRFFNLAIHDAIKIIKDRYTRKVKDTYVCIIFAILLHGAFLCGESRAVVVICLAVYSCSFLCHKTSFIHVKHILAHLIT